MSLTLIRAQIRLLRGFLRAADQTNGYDCEAQPVVSKSTFDILALGGFIRITRGQYIEPT